MRRSRGHLVYTGRITWAPFGDWAATNEGQTAINHEAAKIRFSLLGKTRAASRRLRRRLRNTARNPAVVDAIDAEVEAYLSRVGKLAFADGLPRCGVGLRRLIVVPLVLVSGAVCTALAKRLSQQPAWAALEGRDMLRDFFVTALATEMASAVAQADPSPSRPLDADLDWIVVGTNTSFVWRVPVFGAPPWNGHYYVLELTREPITRAVRQAAADQIDSLEDSLPSLSTAARNDILRRALSPT